MGRSSCCLPKESLNRGAWTALEDKLLTDYIKTHGEGRWSSLPNNAGLKRCGKSCRLRWMNYLRPDIKRGNISPDEEELIIRLHKLLGNRWSLIAGRLPGRTDNEIKNYWNTNLCKRGQHRSDISASERNQKRNQLRKPTKKIPTLIKKMDSSSRCNVDGEKCAELEEQTPESGDNSSTGGSLSSFHTKGHGEKKGSSFFGDLMIDIDEEFGFSNLLDFGLLGNYGNDLSLAYSDNSLVSSEEMLQDWSGNESVEDDLVLNVCSFTSFLDTQEDWLGD